MPWVKTSAPPKNTLPAAARAAIQTEAERFVHEHLRVEAPRAGHKFNYISGYTVKWRGPYVLFTATYTCPGPNARSPEFDRSFARLGCFARDRFNLWARRHNDEWLLLDDGLTLKECLKRLVEDPWFQA